MTLEELLAVAEIVEKLTNRYRDQEAAHKAALTEIRASFNARTSADGKRYEGILDTYRSELDEIDAALNPEREESTALVAKRLVKERDALRAEVADLRGIVDMVHASLGIKRGDHIGNAIAQLKAQTPKRSHPVAVGEYLRRVPTRGANAPGSPAGEVAQVLHVDCDAPTTEYTVKRPNGQQGVWSESGCEPCDPPADHDTTAGKEAAASVIRNSQMTEIKVGDVVEVVSATHKIYTEPEDIGRRGVVTAIDGMRISVEAVPCYELPIRGIVGKCDVRKVTT